MDSKTRTELRELSKLSYEMMNNLGSSIQALAIVSTDSPEFNAALSRSMQLNREADDLLEKQRATIKALKERN
jgi:hypothetical protein